MYPPGGGPRLSITKPSSFFGFDALSLPTHPGASLTFTVDTVPLLDNPPEASHQFPTWYTRPDAQILTLALSGKDLENLNLNAAGVLEFSYRIKYIGDAAQPLFFEGSFFPDSLTVEEADSGGFFPLPQLGIKLLVPRYAMAVQVKVAGSGHATATDWSGKIVRFGAQVTPASTKSSLSNKQRAPVAQAAAVGTLPAFMPRWAHTADIPSISAGAGTVQFRNVARAVVATYATGLGPVPIPPDAVSLIASGAGFFAGYDCY